ncbi:uncharacterized protein LOC129582265 isoform X4 [Paramacrobiotus metropolitanus]|uniref:uncharacterized protein LOC129582265 isoform X4 n=1 Tax=Paramacrobiotus metropolitanus TaxID=2943436 RepID=UPI00244624B1|nr:uncharacterized protein LOC129582265 isoform X4 [Paramacrobiotus metropolitanus]
MDRRTVGKLSGLEFSNLLHFMLENCHALAISKNDFAGMPYLYMVLFYRSTLSSLERGSFSYLPGLSILSLEAALSDAVHWSIGTRQYLWQLHCSCEYEWFRSWWTSTLIPKLEYISSIQSVLTTTNSDTRDGQIRECYSTWGIRNSSLHGFYMLKRPVRSVLLEAATTADILICFEKEKLYIPVDCSAEPFATRPKDINFAQKNFTINGPVCINETATAAPVLQKRDQNYDSITKAEPKIRIREAPYVHKSTFKERRSQILTVAQNRHGGRDFQDDQWLNTSELAHTTGLLPVHRFWEKGIVPYSVSEKFGELHVRLLV